MKQLSARIALGLLLMSAAVSAQAGEQPPAMALPVIESAGSDDRGRIEVNGRPFFPILMYDVLIDEESLAMFREHGFNVLSARAEDAETLRKQGFYAAAHGSATDGLNLDGVLFGIGTDSPALYWKDDLLEKSKADLATMQNAFPRRPIFHAIGYWEDEPAGVFENKLPAKDRYEELIKVLDVSAPYLYPLPYQPVRSVGQAVGRANMAGRGRKPLLPILQLFAWKPEDRYPTPAELKCMVYLSLIQGADGIGYYSYNHVTGKPQRNIAQEQPELWRSVRQINAEAKQIGELLFDSRNDSGVLISAQTSVVECRPLQAAGSSLLLFANTSAETQPISVKWDTPPSAVRRIDNGEKLPLENSAAQFTLGPHEALGLRGEE